MLLLTAEEVRAVLDPDAVIAAVEESLAQEAQGRARTPARTTFDVEHGWFRVMPGALLGGNGRPVVGAKVMHLAAGRGISYLLLLYDERTGELLAVMDASVLTQARTGAVSAVFARRTFPDGVPVAAMYGTGFEARGQLEMICRAIHVGRVRAYSPNADRRADFAREMTARLGLPVEAMGEPQAAAAGAPLVVLATRSRQPVVEAGWFTPGAVLISVGSTRPELREVDPDTVARAGRVIVDHKAQALAESGDLRAALAAGALAEEDVVELSRALAGELPAPRGPQALTIFKPSGTAAQDLAVGRLVYERCRAAGRGRVVSGLPTPKAR